MGTTDPEPIERVHGVIRSAQGTIEVVSDITYGDAKKRRALYPLVLISIAGITALTAWPLTVFIPLILLAVWVGGSGR